ncbi:MAG: ABC transporter permease [Bacteroidetes bacterium]|jgi:polar amino acid transport system permease protein/cystine transport system permease protein|nr:ABC transporter permease [Bacteroidota bacterium]|tara:strand:- start:57 stop:731 length:675 start_codon:yes stop_codon:yes gene_type:complete
MEFIYKLLEWTPKVLPVLLKSAVVTLEVTIGSLFIALILGIIVALARISRLKIISYPALIYTDLMRGTPALVQLFIIYFGLSDLGIEFEPKMAAIIGLGLNGAAYVGEIYRAGIKAIHIGQMEAALTLGMTPINAMRFIIMPQAIRIVLPPLCNYAILLVKDTAIISTIAAPEVMFEARRIVQATFMHSVSGQIYLIAAFIYLIITIPMSFVTKQLEKAKDAWT